MKQLKILKDALALIRQGHAKATLATTQDGEATYVLGEEAVCFCAIGAICKADEANDPWRGYHSSVGALIQVNKDKSVKPKRISESAHQALVAVAHELQTSFNGIWEINDSPGGRGKIVAAYEGAIDKLENNDA